MVNQPTQTNIHTPSTTNTDQHKQIYIHHQPTTIAKPLLVQHRSTQTIIHTPSTLRKSHTNSLNLFPTKPYNTINVKTNHTTLFTRVHFLPVIHVIVRTMCAPNITKYLNYNNTAPLKSLMWLFIKHLNYIHKPQFMGNKSKTINQSLILSKTSHI